MRRPKCKIGRSKHQPIGENAEIQRNTHCRIIQPAEMNCIINFRRMNVSTYMIYNPRSKVTIQYGLGRTCPRGPPMNRPWNLCNKGTVQLSRHVPPGPSLDPPMGTPVDGVIIDADSSDRPTAPPIVSLPTTGSSIMCTEQCKLHKGKRSVDMIQCSVCAEWFHSGQGVGLSRRAWTRLKQATDWCLQIWG